MTDDTQLVVRLTRVPTVLYRRIAQVDYLRSGEHVYKLGGVGLEVWRRLDGARTLQEIADKIAEECGADVHVVRSDVAEFGRELVKRGLATIAANGSM